MEETATAANVATGAGLGFGLLILLIAINGLVIGALARWALPGPDPMSYWKTALFGIGGSAIGGLVGQALHVPTLVSFALAVAGAAGLIWFFRRRSKAPGA